MFFQSPVHLQRLFYSISFNEDIFEKARHNLKGEMDTMEEFLLDELPMGEKSGLLDSIHSRKERPNEHVLCLLRHLASLWDQNLDRVVFVAEKDNECLKECPEPHLVVPMGDVTNIALFVDYTKIYSCMDWPTAFASLIAVHYLADLQYGGECSLLKTYLEEEVCDFAKDITRTKKKVLKKLTILQTKKRKILLKKHQTTITDRRLV
jgi:hypothetical protein